MPTKHRRIAIIRDPEVDRALAAARDAGSEARSDAAIARELILRGAREVERHNDDRDPFREWVRAGGGTLSSGSIRELVEELGPAPAYDRADPHPAQRVLAELREDRI